MDKGYLKETADDLRMVARRLEAMMEGDLDPEELELLARQRLQPLVHGLKDFAYKVAREKDL